MESTIKYGSLALLGISTVIGAACGGGSSPGPVNPGVGSSAAASPSCAPGAKCVRTDPTGHPKDDGAYTAQCSGTFPDYIDIVSPGYTGTPFVMAQDYPKEPPSPGKMPWKGIDFRTQKGSNDYMAAVRKYIYDGMLPANWVPQNNKLVRWYHVPWMTTGKNRREFTHGLTQERSLPVGELGNVNKVKNYAVGFYNDVGAYAIGQVWVDPNAPKPELGQSAEGTVVAKVLFTAGTREDWGNPPQWLLDGAPEWQANVCKNDDCMEKGIATVRLLQMDVAIRDKDAGVTGWIFGTFAYDKDAPGANGWEKMVPVGLMWGNDPNLKSGEAPKESVINERAPAYAKGHLGLGNRLNGPVDNPASSCMSCHGTAEFPPTANLVPPSSCTTDAQKALWFRNFGGNVPFGDVTNGTCEVVVKPGLIALDYSLQQSVALENFAATSNDSTRTNANPCTPLAARTVPAAPDSAIRNSHGEIQMLPVER